MSVGRFWLDHSNHVDSPHGKRPRGREYVEKRRWHMNYRRRSDICDTSLRTGSNLTPLSANNILLSVFSLSWCVHWCEYQRNLHVFLSGVFLLLFCQRI